MTSINLFRSNRRRTGKIARLPAPLRAAVNQMLDDGLTYAAIIHRLGPHGRGMNYHSLKRWFRGGYQDHLRTERDKAASHIHHQFVEKLLREKDINCLPDAVSAELLQLLLDLQPGGRWRNAPL